MMHASGQLSDKLAHFLNASSNSREGTRIEVPSLLLEEVRGGLVKLASLYVTKVSIALSAPHSKASFALLSFRLPQTW